jgi:hypothetical protein
MDDGRTVAVERAGDDLWRSWIEGDSSAKGIGTPLNSSLAETLGYPRSTS